MPVYGPNVVFGPDVVSGTDFSPALLSGLRIWTRSDDPDVVAGGGVITSIPNRGSIGGLIENTGTQRPADSILKGRRSPLFDGSDDYLIDDWATSENKFLHDGTGCTLLAVVNRTNIATLDDLLGTTTNNANFAGCRLRGETTGAVTLRIGNGSGSWLVDHTSGTAAAPAATTRVLWLKHKTGESPEWIFGYDQTTDSSGSYTGTASSADPSQAGFQVGHISGVNTIGHIPEIVAYGAYKSDPDIQRVVDYLQSKWA